MKDLLREVKQEWLEAETRRKDDEARLVQVVLVEPAIPPIQVEIAALAGKQVTVPGLPPIPLDILELEGRVEGLEEAIRQMRADTHPCLEPAKAAVRQTQEQWQALARDLEATAPALPEGTRHRLHSAAVKKPPVSPSQLCAIAPNLTSSVLLPYVQSLRNLDRATVAQDAVHQGYESARQNEIKRLETELVGAQASLETRKEEDLDAVLKVFFDPDERSAGFPAGGLECV